MRRFPAIVCLLACLAAPAIAERTTISPLILAALLAEPDPQIAIAEIGDALQGLTTAADPDPRALFDLVELKARHLLTLGDLVGAASQYTDLGIFAKDNREILQEDPISLLRTALRLFEQLGDFDAALQVSELILREHQDNAAPNTTLIATMRDMAALSRKMSDLARADVLIAEADALAAAGDTPATRTLVTGGFSPVDVYYATDRARTGASYPPEFYGYDRGALEYGIAQVTIPDTHRPGQIEVPSIWSLEFGPNEAKHIVLQSINPVSNDTFFARLSGAFEAREDKELFVFIHGYNVSFDQAAKRTAQLAYDMNFAGVPVLFSWPSRGSTMGYMSDSAVVRLSGRRLRGFLEDLVARSGAETLHLIGHSMGNRALTDALEIIGLTQEPKGSSGPIFSQIIFAAPDVDVGLFAEILPTLRPLAERLTLYASDEDWALEASRKLHGNASRAGQGGDHILAHADIDSIDMSELGEDMLAHSYFAQDSSALLDLYTLFWQNLAPQRRCGLVQARMVRAIAIWRYVGGVCRDTRLLGLIAALREADARTDADTRSVLKKHLGDDAIVAEYLPVIQQILKQ